MIFPRRATVAILATASLAGCGLIASPEPDPALTTLMKKAEADGRAEDAQALEQEILRLCGQFEDGTTPESCTQGMNEAPAQSPSENPAQAILDSVADVPQESLPLLVEQYMALVHTDQGTVPPPHAASGASEKDTAAIKEALEHELASQYLLGVAQSFAAPELKGRIDDLTAKSAERIVALEASLPPEHPVSEPAYSFGNYTAVTDEATAGVFVDELAADTNALYKHLASEAESPSWRYQSLVMAGGAK